jgi:hypothetical protein
MKKLLTGLITVGSVTLGTAAFLKFRKREPIALLPTSSGQPTHDAMFRYVTTFILPVWTAAGLSDYLCHRRTKIERTSGTQESIFHMLMMMEGAPLMIAGLFLEINAGALAIMTASAAIHEATVIRDLQYAADKRPTLPAEQHTHSFLEVLPFSILAFAAASHWDQFAAMFGLGREPADFSIRFKRPPLSASGLLVLMTATMLLVGLPHAEELWRCWRAERRGEKGADTPASLPEIMNSFAA